MGVVYMINFSSLNVSQMLIPNNVQYQKTVYKGVPALQVSEVPAYNAAFAKADVNKINQGNAYLEVTTIPFFEGLIDVDVAAVRNNFSYQFPITATQNLLVGAMAGLTFRQQSVNQYDAFYLRAGAGRLNNPAPTAPLSHLGAQYISPPTWIFSNLQKSKPLYTSGADVAEGEWTHICLAICNNTLTAWVGSNPNPVFNQVPLLGTGLPGPIGLFVDSGTVTYFANLRVSPTMPLNLF